MTYLESFQVALRPFLRREPEAGEVAEIAVIALVQVTRQRAPLSAKQWRVICEQILGEQALARPTSPHTKTAGLDFSALNAILVNIQPR